MLSTIEPPRIALLMVSHSPSAAKIGLGKSHESVLLAWREFVIAPLLSDAPGTSLTTFLCFNGARNASESHETWQTTLTAAGSSVDVVLTNSDDDYADQFERLDACATAMSQHEVRASRLFTHVIRGRPDLLFVRRVPRLSELPAHSVSLRARALANDEPRAVPVTAMQTASATWLDQCEALQFLTHAHARSCEDHSAEGKYKKEFPSLLQLEQSVDCYKAALEALRRRMRLARVRTCALVDDQFAIMPRHLSNAYTAIEPGGPSWSDHGLRAAPFLAHARYADEESVRASYGAAGSPDEYLRACPLIGAGSVFGSERSAPGYGLAMTFDRLPGWRDHFLRGFGGKFSTVPSRKNFNGRDGACCEYRLTWRLVGRRVPFQIVPIPFVGAGSKDFVRQWDKLLKRPQNRSVLC